MPPPSWRDSIVAEAGVVGEGEEGGGGDGARWNVEEGGEFVRCVGDGVRGGLF